MVSHEVWQALDPNAGRLSRRTTKRLWLVAWVTVLVAAGLGASLRSGLLTARLEWSNQGYSYSAHPGGPVGHEVVVTNTGLVDVRLLGAGRSGPGLELTNVEGAFPLTLGPGDTAAFILTFRLTDCSAITDDPWPVPVRVRRWWGEQTVYVPLPTQSGPNRPNGIVSYTGDRNPYDVEWQRKLALIAC